MLKGKEVRVSYVADANGFRVLSNDLPQAPVDNQVAPVFTGVGPAPVEDTPEVIAAKAEFFKLYKEAEAAAAAAPESRKKRSVFTYPYPLATTVPAYAKSTIKTAHSCGLPHSPELPCSFGSHCSRRHQIPDHSLS